MTDFVLVHGAWHGGWCWERVGARLEAAGHRVFAPALTGVGERFYLLKPGVNLSTHIGDIEALIRKEDLHDVVLVGHSYGGLVTGAIADRLPERVAHVVYLDAFVPVSGRSLASLTTPERASLMRAAVDPLTSGFPPQFSAEGLGVNPADRAMVDARLTLHPWDTFEEAITLTGALDTVPSTYVLSANNPSRHFEPIAEAAKQKGWAFHVLEGGHCLMLDAPDAVTAILLDVA